MPLFSLLADAFSLRFSLDAAAAADILPLPYRVATRHVTQRYAHA